MSTIQQLRESLPNVGDILTSGEVVYVNREHLWYRVKKSNGSFDSFRVPSGRSYDAPLWSCETPERKSEHATKKK